MYRILFVCHGNICRSPMAEFVMKDLVKRAGCESDFHIESAATSTEELGNPPHPGTRKILNRLGIDCSAKRARQLTARDGAAWDYIIGMDEANVRNITRIIGSHAPAQVELLLSFAHDARGIADPWYTGDFETTYEDVLAGCEAFLDYLTAKPTI